MRFKDLVTCIFHYKKAMNWGGKNMEKKVVCRMFVVLLLVVSLVSAGCAGNGFSRREGGAVIGGAAGAGIGQLIGVSAEATLIGLLIGTVLGAIVGNEMDKLDRQNVNYAYEHVPDNQSHSWQNPNTGDSYNVTPKTTYGSNSRPCRTAIIDSVIDGKREKVHSTACRDANGVWQLQ